MIVVYHVAAYFDYFFRHSNVPESAQAGCIFWDIISSIFIFSCL